jgi:uncharacterized protein
MATDREVRTLPIDTVEWRKSGAGDGQMTVRGHAAVFRRRSLDLGGFREVIEPGFFRKVLDENPDLWALWDHDTKYVLGRTKNKTLELREDPLGLHFWARVAPTSYAEDLRILMERGDVDQASFLFSVREGGDDWKVVEENGEQVVERRLLPDGCGALYDVTICAAGAYPQTDSQVVRSLRSRLAAEISEGHLPEEVAAALGEEDRAGITAIDPTKTGAAQLTQSATAAATSTGTNIFAPTATGSGDTTPQPPLDVEQQHESSREAGEDTQARRRQALLDEMAVAIAEERDRAREFSRRKYSLRATKGTTDE